jgi:cell division protein FtsB
MKAFQRKKKSSSSLYVYLAILFLLLLIFGLGKASWGAFLKERDSGRERGEAEDKLSSLEERRDILEDKIKALKTAEGIESEIREQFQVAKPGERMVVVVQEKKPAEEPSEPTSSLTSRFFDIFR